MECVTLRCLFRQKHTLSLSLPGRVKLKDDLHRYRHNSNCSLYILKHYISLIYQSPTPFLLRRFLANR